MKLFRNSVRNRKRSSFFERKVATASQTTYSPTPIGFSLFVLLLLCLLLNVIIGIEGELTSFSCSANANTRLSSSLGALIIIYSAFPYYAVSKSIRKGMEVQVPVEFSSSPQSPSSLFSSRTLQVSSEEGNGTASELLDSNSSESSYKMTLMKQFRSSQKKRKGGRLKRQMGMAAEIALIAPALQTMGCIPKFFCGMNSKPPAEETSALNDLAYLIRVAMLDDDDVELEEPLFTENTNNRGKDGLSGNKKGRNPVNKIKDDLIIENLAEEELIQEDPANLPFVWQDMEHRIKIKTKPGNKNRFDDEIMDSIIIEPEQSSMTAILTGLKSVFRIGRSVDPLSNGNSSQVSPRSLKSQESSSVREKRQRWRRQWKRPFWKTPKFRQDMELAQRIGKTDQDDTKCSSTFNLCPYTVHEMMEIVHGGYKKRNKKKPDWFLNAQGPPESSEEVEVTKKPFKDKDNLMTTTTERTQWYPTDPEHQILYAVFPHKAIEKGFTTLPTTKRPTTTTKKPDANDSEKASKRRRKNPTKIQQHVEYENEDDDSSKELDPEQMDLAINNKRRRNPWNRPPPQQRPGLFQQHRVPQGRRPMLRPQPTVFVKQISHEDISNDDADNDKSSSEEQKDDKPKRKHAGSGSVEDEVSSEEVTQQEETSSPVPPPSQNPPDQVLLTPQQSPQPLLPFLQNGNSQLKPPIALPRPKYSLQHKQNKKQKGRRPQLPQIPQNQANKEVKDQTSDEEDEKDDDEESQENSSEEVKNTETQQSSPPQEMPNNPPHVMNPNNLRGRPSEEIKGPAQNLLPNTPHTSFEEDEPEDSDEKQNSNSASFEGSKEQDLISMEMAKVPKPARPPPPPHMRMNGSYEYSEESHGGPQLRPISYSYFKPPPGQNGGEPPSSHQQGNQGSPPPNTSTQKYSTGFLSYFFGKNKDKSKQPGSFENQHRPPPPQQDMSQEENADDDDDDDDDSEEGDDNRRKDAPQHFTGPEGKFETGHLGKKPVPFNPDFKPPQKPQRPYKGSTSMEDSDEKRFRSPSSPPPTKLSPPSTTPKIPELPRPVLYLGKPHRIVIPPPATPPSYIQPTTLPTSTSTTTKAPKDSEEDDEPESDEEKQSEESKEEDDASKESKESDEVQEKKKSKTKTNKISKKSTQKKEEELPQLPPIAHYKPATSAATPTAPPKPSTTQATKTRSDSSDEKHSDDSNQTKEDDSAEEKPSKEDGSDEVSSEEDDDNKKKKQPPQRPQRKPEDDELDQAPVLPPLPPVGGDIAAVGEILGTPVEDDENPDEIVPYNPDEDIPAPPPLVQGFATSLEILVPSNAPPVIPSNNVAQQAPAGAANQVAGGVPNNGVRSAGANRNPSEQAQGVRNPGSSQSNRGPSSGNRNRNPGNNREQQQEKPKEKEGDGDKKENSSEEKDKSSEESSEEDFAKGVLSGFDFDSIALGPEDPEEANDDAADKNPPEPPPVFTGSPAQKQHLKLSANQPRPVPHSKPHFHRPSLSRNEALQQQKQHQSNLKPLRMPIRPSSSFSVSHLLRPLMTRPVYQRKPLDPKVVEWIRESYGIPDLNNNNNNHHHNHNHQLPPHMRQPNRSGLESQDVKKETTPTSSEKKSKEAKRKSNKNKSTEKSGTFMDKRETGSESKLISDYITAEQEAEMAQALFNSSENKEDKSDKKKAAETTTTKSTLHNGNQSGERRKNHSSAENTKSSSEKRKHISLITKASSLEKRKQSTSTESPSSIELLMSSFAGTGSSSSSSQERKKQPSSSEKNKPLIIRLKSSASSSSSESTSIENKKTSSTEKRNSSPSSSELKSKAPTPTRKTSFELRDRLNLSASVEKKVISSREKSKSSSAERKMPSSSEVRHKSKSASSERRRTPASSEKTKKPVITRITVKPIMTSSPKVVIKSKSVLSRINRRPSFPGLPPIYGKQKLQG